MKKASLIRQIIKARNKAGLSMRSAALQTQRPGRGNEKGTQLSASAWFRIEAGQRCPTWDSLILMAKTVGIKVEVTTASARKGQCGRR